MRGSGVFEFVFVLCCENLSVLASVQSGGVCRIIRGCFVFSCGKCVDFKRVLPERARSISGIPTWNWHVKHLHRRFYLFVMPPSVGFARQSVFSISWDPWSENVLVPLSARVARLTKCFLQFCPSFEAPMSRRAGNVSWRAKRFFILCTVHHINWQEKTDNCGFDVAFDRPDDCIPDINGASFVRFLSGWLIKKFLQGKRKPAVSVCTCTPFLGYESRISAATNWSLLVRVGLNCSESSWSVQLIVKMVLINIEVVYSDWSGVFKPKDQVGSFSHWRKFCRPKMELHATSMIYRTNLSVNVKVNNTASLAEKVCNRPED